MPSLARVLQFPTREVSRPLTKAEASAAADGLLLALISESENSSTPNLEADVVAVAVSKLREVMNTQPAGTFEQATSLYSRLVRADRVGVFDERDYFLGEVSVVAGTTLRHLGRFDEAARWFDLADASFRLTVNPGPSCAQVAYARLAILYDQKRPDRVVDAIPMLIEGFERMGMQSEARKARYLEAMSLKLVGREEAAYLAFDRLSRELPTNDSVLLPRVLIELGSEHTRLGRFEEAVKAYELAADALSSMQDPLTSAHLKGTIAEAYRSKGEFNVAVDCYRIALAEFAKLDMQAMVAYYRVLTAETLLLADRDREAEWELRSALPTIEEQRLVAEGLAAVSLLRESIQRRSVDRKALSAVRGHLSGIV